MLRFSFYLLVATLLTSATQAQAQQIYYPPGTSTYQPIYPIAAPLPSSQYRGAVQSAPTVVQNQNPHIQHIREVAPYPIEYPAQKKSTKKSTVATKKTNATIKKPAAKLTKSTGVPAKPIGHRISPTRTTQPVKQYQSAPVMRNYPTSPGVIIQQPSFFIQTPSCQTGR